MWITKTRDSNGRFIKGHKTNVGYKPTKETREKLSKALKGRKYPLGKKHSEETKQKIRIAKLGKLNPQWKTKNPTYGSVHTWLLKNYKHLKIKCHKCDSTKFLEFALRKSKKHTHNIKNYMILCSSCHKKYDYTEDRKEKLSKAHKGRKIIWADKISKANIGRKMSDNAKKLMSLAAKVNYKKRKIDKYGKFI